MKRLREICDQHGILLVFDEVICGFGRTGKAFAAQSFGVTPDMMTMAKGLTNGAQPMGAVAVSRAHPRHDHGGGAGGRDRVFPRLHVFRASGRLARRGSPRSTSTARKDLFERGARLSPYFLDGCSVAEGRRPASPTCAATACSRRSNRSPPARPGTRGHVLQKKLFDNGLHLKTTGDSAIIAPPLIAEKSHIDMIVECLRKTLAADLDCS